MLVMGCAGIAVRTVTVDQAQLLQIIRLDMIGHWCVTLLAGSLILLGLISLVTLADAQHRPESLRELRVVIIEPIAALVLTRWTVRRHGMWPLVIGLVGAACAVAVVAVGQVLTGRGEVIGDGVGRATGPYPHPNNLALYLERIALCATAIALLARRYRRLMVPIVVLLMLGLLATFSRGALLAAIAGIALLIWISRQRHAWRWFAAGIVILIAAFLTVAGNRFLASGSSGDVSSRELIWRSSLRMVADHLWFGVGLDQFLNQYAPRYVSPAGWPERYTSHPHNLVLDVWLRLGIAGLAVLVGAIAMLMRAIRGLRRQTIDSEPWVLGVAASAMIVGGLAHGLVDNGFFLPDLAVLTWIGVGLIEFAVQPRPPTSAASKWRT